ncbi:hypothetical protein D3C76_1469200 [compost metagenome]
MNGVAQLAHQRDELGQPGVQAFVEDFVDAGVAQACVHFRRQALRGTAIGPWQLGEDLVDLFSAGAQGTWHIGPQQQQFGDMPSARRVSVNFGVCLE